MPPRILAKVKPELLAWARNSMHYDTYSAAKKLGIDEELLLQWENGDAQPTISQLRNLANVYKRPLAVFFLQSPPKDFSVMKDFRRLDLDIQTLSSPNLQYQMRLSRYKRSVALDLLEALEINITKFSLNATINHNKDDLAHSIREYLHVNLQDQINLSDRYKAFNYWKSLIENVGILVFQTTHTHPVEIEEMRGLSITENFLPVILLNSKDTPYGKIFTLLHELTHIILNQDGICDLHEYTDIKTDDQHFEYYCNFVAGAIIIPKEIILTDSIVANHNTSEWSDEELDYLSRKFSASREVVLRRLLLLGKTTNTFYSEKRAEYIKQYRESSLNKKGRPQYHVLVSSSLGKPYINIVLEAYQQERISSSDVSDYLGVKLKHVDKIREYTRQ